MVIKLIELFDPVTGSSSDDEYVPSVCAQPDRKQQSRATDEPGSGYRSHTVAQREQHSLQKSHTGSGGTNSPASNDKMEGPYHVCFHCRRGIYFWHLISVRAPFYQIMPKLQYQYRSHPPRARPLIHTFTSNTINLGLGGQEHQTAPAAGNVYVAAVNKT